MRDVRNSRKGLSPLLAIIIGLIVTIVAGILLAQLYFSYAATISARPAANIEYVDLVTDSAGNGILAVNIKNTGNVPIKMSAVDVQLDIDGGGDDCSDNRAGSGNPGGTISVTCSLTGLTIGGSYSGSVVVEFTDGSSQVYAFTVRARSA